MSADLAPTKWLLAEDGLTQAQPDTGRRAMSNMAPTLALHNARTAALHAPDRAIWRTLDAVQMQWFTTLEEGIVNYRLRR